MNIKLFFLILCTFLISFSAEVDLELGVDQELAGVAPTDLSFSSEEASFPERVQELESLEVTGLDDDQIWLEAKKILDQMQEEGVQDLGLIEKIIKKGLGQAAIAFKSTPVRMKEGSQIIKLIKDGSPITGVLQHPLVRDNVAAIAGVAHLYTINWDHIQNRHFFNSLDYLKRFLVTIKGKMSCLANIKTGVIAATITDPETKKPSSKTIFPIGEPERALFKKLEELLIKGEVKPAMIYVAGSAVLAQPTCSPFYIEALYLRTRSSGAPLVVSSVFPIFDFLDFVDADEQTVIVAPCACTDERKITITVKKDKVLQFLKEMDVDNAKEAIKYYNQATKRFVVDITLLLVELYPGFPLEKGVYAQLEQAILDQEEMSLMRKALRTKFSIKSTSPAERLFRARGALS